MSEENDTSSATDQSVKDTGITAGEPINLGPEICSVDYRGVSFDLHLYDGKVFAVNDFAAPLFCLYDDDYNAALAQAFRAIDFWYYDVPAPAEVSDKRQDWKVADERPQLSREQIDDMNSGD